MLFSVLSAPTEPNLNALPSKKVSGIPKMQTLVIMSICAYSMICDAGFRKHPRPCLHECASHIWDQLKKFCFIYRLKYAFLMNVARKCFK